MPNLGIFDQKCFISVFLGKSFKNTIVIFKISILKFVYLQNFMKKIPKFGTKNAWFGYFWARIWKQFCHIWNPHPQICLFAKFHKKTKMPNFGTKNAWFGYFGAGVWKQYCHIWNQHPGIYLTAKCGT